ncbi:MAG: hypothetical protein KJ747_03080 [Actinobacteria bacterium]|nr:hypothetical protein [Actinomycetota bacterium]MCG2808541.1 hypothetical protein [Coriobacteriia bacterium]
MKHRILIGSLVVTAVLLAGVIVMYAFGTPQAPSPGSAARTEVAAGQIATEVTGSVPAPDPSSPLAIQIPGCVCHSDDPKLVEEHASYRMNQCFGCHAGGMPEMAQ